MTVDLQTSATTEELFRRHARTGDQQVRNLLVERHLRLAYHIARKYGGRGVDHDDLQQVAFLGLVGAVNRFDPDAGAKFTTYAGRTIEGEIKRYFRDRTWAVQVPRAAKELRLQMRPVVTELTRELGRPPSEQDLAERMGESPAAVRAALAAALAYVPATLDRLAVAEPVSEAASLEDAALDRVLAGQLLEGLPHRDQQIVLLRFVGGLSQGEIADRIGVSQMQISRLLRRALARMRSVATSPGVGAASAWSAA